MAVDDHGLEVLKKSGEEVTPGDKSDYYVKVGPTPGHPIEFQLAEPDTPTIYNVTSPAGANDEFSVELTGTVRKFMIRCPTSPMTVSFVSAGPFISLSRGSNYVEENVKVVNLNVYLKTSLAEKVVEVLTWS